MFCDELQIKVVAGKGGNGCASFRREKFVPKGGPDGGDGGMGGDIIIKVNPNLNTLGHLARKKLYKAKNGEAGKGKKMYGKNAEHFVIEVPKGTIIFNKDKSEQLADLTQIGSQIIMAKGGIGGSGNAHFATSTHQAPRFAETGEPGEKNEIILELKLVADVGLIGLPSAGKSTLISVISNARPKIAAYHFTTLIPNLGVVSDHNFVVADIPGLIEGASSGKGLGIQFLKHIKRTKLLVHIIDGSLENPSGNYKTIKKELKEFDKELIKKPEIIVINKIDLLSEEEIQKVTKELKKTTKKTQIFTISAITKEGLKPVLFEIQKILTELKKKEQAELAKTPPEEIPILRPHLDKVKYEIEKIEAKKDNKNNKIFHISGKRIEQLIIMTDTRNQEGLERIYYYIEKCGLKNALEKKKAKVGDILRIKAKEIPFRP
jgi:GTPase